MGETSSIPGDDELLAPASKRIVEAQLYRSATSTDASEMKTLRRDFPARGLGDAPSLGNNSLSGVQLQVDGTPSGATPDRAITRLRHHRRG
jgi:hypothetical protein